jgi:hypothetical protein
MLVICETIKSIHPIVVGEIAGESALGRTRERERYRQPLTVFHLKFIIILQLILGSRSLSFIAGRVVFVLLLPTILPGFLFFGAAAFFFVASNANHLINAASHVYGCCS